MIYISTNLKINNGLVFWLYSSKNIWSVRKKMANIIAYINILSYYSKISSYLVFSKLKLVLFIIFACSLFDLIIYQALFCKWVKLTSVITAFATA